VAQAEPPHTEQTLADYLTIARRHKWLIIVATVLVPIVAYVVASQQPKVYSASADVYLNRQDLASAVTGISPNGFSDSDRYARTQAALARNRQVARRAIELSKVQGRAQWELLDASSVSPRENTDLLRFTVLDSDPLIAARLVNAYAEAFTIYRLEVDTSNLAAARKELEAQLAEFRRQGATNTDVYRDLVGKAQNLRTLELLLSRASVVRTALLGTQIEPTPQRSAILGAMLGVLLGVGLAFLRNALDKRVRTSDEIDTALGIPLLARLPVPSRGSRRLAMLADPHDVDAEAVRQLRTGLELANLDAGAKVVMVTSAAPVEGKSTTISNLAVALARSGWSVALVDCDLRQPAIASFFSLERRPGLTDIALGRVRLENGLTTIRIPDLAPATGGRDATTAGRLDVLPAGPPPPSPGEFVGSHALARVIDRLREIYDYVLLDAPPMLAVGDAMTLSTRADAMFVVVRMGSTDRVLLRDLSRAIHASPIRKLGYALTGVESRELYGVGGYGYISGDKRGPATSPDQGESEPTERSADQPRALREVVPLSQRRR
jgi:capsular exopolysaccharide synthesis family protein